jgi:ion channel
VGSPLRLIALVTGVFLVLLIYWEAFETLVFPRRVSRRFRFTRAFYQATWVPWRAIGSRLKPGRSRENFLSIYGPISLLLLLVTWIGALIVAFALMHWGGGSKLQAPAGLQGFVPDLLLSGATLFTLSLGDIAPASHLERLFTIVEGGTGLAFLAMVVGYLPVLYQAFSRREVNVSLLDARAGSPPSAGELLVRHFDPRGAEMLSQLLEQWDRWSADLLETHISFPVLAYYRSQHDNQSWVAALTTILDVCALLIAAVEQPARSARLAFAMARHAAVDLTRTFGLTPRPAVPDRLTLAELAQLRQVLRAAGFSLRQGPEVDERLARLRGMYEPYMNALGEFLLMRLPTWVSPQGAQDNWQSMA